MEPSQVEQWLAEATITWLVECHLEIAALLSWQASKQSFSFLFPFSLALALALSLSLSSGLILEAA